MTRAEAIRIARETAASEGWIWREPVSAIRSRRWLIGPATWRVTSNAESRGLNVVVTIEDATGVVRRKSFLPR
jgi:hypothetical protein